MHGSTPAMYEDWLATVHARAGSGGIVLINAWNEWAEGAHLEPDLKYGDAYLKATARGIGAPLGDISAEVTTPLAATPFVLRDRFGELYLDALQTQMRLQRRLSRLEATFERQVEEARQAATAEANEMRAHALTLAREVSHLRDLLASTSNPRPAT
ncbi:MAG: glycosyltransferase WbsX domain protein [Pseudonocardiales bacterium]|nr:glycosyltransferase WbsX domain protein [Pseudonocardiales bacterium]